MWARDTSLLEKSCAHEIPAYGRLIRIGAFGALLFGVTQYHPVSLRKLLGDVASVI